MFACETHTLLVGDFGACPCEGKGRTRARADTYSVGTVRKCYDKVGDTRTGGKKSRQQGSSDREGQHVAFCFRRAELQPKGRLSQLSLGDSLATREGATETYRFDRLGTMRQLVLRVEVGTHE